MSQLNKLFISCFPNYFSIKNSLILLIFIFLAFNFLQLKLNSKKLPNLKSVEELIKKEKYKEAQEALDLGANNLNKNNSKFYFLKGRVYQELKLNHQAFEAYTQSIFLKKENYKAFINRAMIRGALQDFNGALEDLKEANKIKPNKSQYYLNLGIVYGSLNKPVNSIESFLKAINIDKNFHDAYNNLGITYYHQNNLNLACDTWKIPADKGNQNSKLWIEDYCQ